MGHFHIKELMSFKDVGTISVDEKPEIIIAVFVLVAELI